MTSKKIYSKWVKYMNEEGSKKSPRPSDEEPVILYGSDYFKIDKAKNRIRLPEAGWMQMQTNMRDVRSKDIKWVAVTIKDSQEYVFTGNYDPFDRSFSAECPLWDKDEFIAIPYSQDLMEKFEKLGLL